MTAKAYNGRILTEWIQRCLSDAARRPNEFTDPNQQLTLLAQCASLVSAGSSGGPEQLQLRTSLNRWHGIQERCGRYMDMEERGRYVDSLNKFIQRYVALAQQAVRLGKDEFRLKPKLHVP